MILLYITFGILVFEAVVFFAQWILFRRIDFICFSLFCLGVAAHNYLYNEPIFGLSTYFEEHQTLSFFLRRQLAILSFYFYARFVRIFIELKKNAPTVNVKVILIEKLLLVNMAIQAIFACINSDPVFLDYSFIIAFILLSIFALYLSVLVIKKRNILANLILIGSSIVLLSIIVHILFNAFGDKTYDSQWIRELGFLMNILLINIGLVYKFNYLSQKEVEQQKSHIQHLMEKEQLATKLLNIRQRISMDIHDDVMGGLSTIRISSDLIKELPPEKTAIFAQKISATTQDITTRLNAIIWSLDNENDEVNNFVVYIKTFAHHFFEASNIQLTFHTNLKESASFPLAGDIRKNLFFTIKEALHNILKHAQADTVIMNITYLNKQLQIQIIDDGNGFSEGRQFGNGLNNMQKRIREIGGTFHLDSSKGTTITITTPF